MFPIWFQMTDEISWTVTMLSNIRIQCFTQITIDVTQQVIPFCPNECSGRGTCLKSRFTNLKSSFLSCLGNSSSTSLSCLLDKCVISLKQNMILSMQIMKPLHVNYSLLMYLCGKGAYRKWINYIIINHTDNMTLFISKIDIKAGKHASNGYFS